MASLDYVFQGAPPIGTGVGNIAQPGSALFPSVGLDSLNGVGYVNAGKGWVPQVPAVLAGGVAAGNNGHFTAQVAASTPTLVLAVPAHMTGLYQITLYAVSTDTPTAAALPGLSVAFTDGDTSNATTATSAATASTVAAANVVNNGTVYVYAKGGTNITAGVTGAVAGSGTALTYNLSLRIEYLG